MSNYKESLKKLFGFESFRYPQEEIIACLMNQQDIIAILPTGAGKSITYQLPAYLLGGLTIVISPLISLMKDQVDNLAKKSLGARYYNSLLNQFEIYEILEDLRANKIKLLYISPEKLNDQRLCMILKKSDISMIVLDEAHTLMWHLDFRDAFLYIKPFIEGLNKRPVISAVTATATSRTIEEIKFQLGLINPKIFKTSFDRKMLYYRVVKIKKKDEFLINYLNNKKELCGIIYALTRKKVMEIYNLLSKNNLDVTFYHGGLATDIKNNNQRRFMNGTAKIMVCTISFALGIDKPDIRFVINYNMPASLEDLSQMSGRCSRDGKSGECIVLFSYDDVETCQYFIDNIEKPNISKSELRNIKKYKEKQLSDIVKYCNTTKCLHQEMCKYFGEKLSNRCNNCSNCQKKTRLA